MPIERGTQRLTVQHARATQQHLAGEVLRSGTNVQLLPTGEGGDARYSSNAGEPTKFGIWRRGETNTSVRGTQGRGAMGSG